MDKKQKLESLLGAGRLKIDIDLSPFTTIKIKSHASFLYEAKSIEDFVKAKKASLELNLELIVLGGGSNVAILKNNPDTLFVINRYFKKELIKEDKNNAYILVSSGYPVSLLVRNTTEAGYSGFENHLGLPGSVGGAIYMNSKWTRPVSYFGDNLVSAKILSNDGKIKEVYRDYFQFAYDHSILQKTKEILLEVVFKLKKTDPKTLVDNAMKALEYRQQTQPHGVATSGCFFKNISKETQKQLNLPSDSASYLIDKADLKGLRVGSFIVSDKHANFIVNQGGGEPKDLVKLLRKIKNKIKSKFGVELEEEVIII